MTPQTRNGFTTFRLWAPFAEKVKLRLLDSSEAGNYTMKKESGGYHSFTLPCGHGKYYQYVIRGQAFPDPASAFQPDGIYGPSMVVDFESFEEKDKNRQGVALDDLIIYEIHLGTFTDKGTYTTAIKRLDNLVELGVTAIELMPLAECPGRWNWGYDGASIYAPSHNYGSPEELRRFVSACHQRGLAVILDVVYNHFGPEGNYLDQFGPYFGGASTPWGVAPSVSGKAQKPARDFFVDNALHWIENYGFDGLRFAKVTSSSNQTMALCKESDA